MTATAYLFASNHRLLYTFDFLSSQLSVVMAAVEGRLCLSSMNFSEDDGDNSSLVSPSKFDARYLKANKSKSDWSGSFEQITDSAAKYLNMK